MWAILKSQNELFITAKTKHIKCLFMLAFRNTSNSCRMLVAASYNKVKIKKPKDVALIINNSLVANNKPTCVHTYFKTDDSLQIIAVRDTAETFFKISAISSRAYV